MTNLISNDRVRCIHGGPGFRGLHGTIVDTYVEGVEGTYRVEWDTPPAEDVRRCSDPHGGAWGPTSLHLLARLEDGTEVGYGDRVMFADDSASRYLDDGIRSEGLTVIVDHVERRDGGGWMIDLKRESAPFDNEDGDEHKGFGHEFFLAAPVSDKEPEVEESGRPAIDFSGDSRATAREYAKDANSKVLKADHRAILEEVRCGATVDAVALNEALVAAMRAATTRDGQSTARRERAKRIAHLHHITQAVLENAIDGLPAYEQGQRSRAVEDAKRGILAAKAEVEAASTKLREAAEERATLTQAASDERRRLVAEIDTLRSNLAQTIREANEFEATLEYAKGFLLNEARAKVEGFAYGFNVGADKD